MRERGQGRRKTLSSRARARGAAIDGALRCHAGKNITVVASRRPIDGRAEMSAFKGRQRARARSVHVRARREREMHDHFCTLLDLPLSISVRM